MSNTHSISESRRPSIGRSTTTRSSQRSTETIGDPPNCASPANAGRWRRSSRQEREQRGRRQRADDGVGRLDALLGCRPDDDLLSLQGPLREADAARASGFEHQRLRSRAAPDDASARLEIGREPLEQRAPAAPREHEPRGAMVAQEGLLVDAVEQHRRGALHGLVQDRDRQRIPEQAARGLALARAAQVLGERQAHGRPAEAHREAEADRLQLDGERKPQPQQAHQQVERRYERRAVERAHAALVDPLELQLVLERQQIAGPRAAQQVERRVVAADHQMGAVVHLVAGRRVARGGGAAAQDAAPLQQHDLVPPFLEPDGRGEAGEAAAEDDDLHAPQASRASVRSAIQSLRGFESWTRGPATGWPRRAHSSSTAR